MKYKIWHENNLRKYERYVQSPGEAVVLLEKIADRDLKNPKIEWSAQGLLVKDESEDWEEWEDESGDDISRYSWAKGEPAQIVKVGQA